MILKLPLFRSISPLREALSLTLGHKICTVKIRRMARARRLTLRVEPTGDICLTVPQRCSEKRMQAFVLEHKDWIAQQLDAVPSPVPFTAGGKIPLRGVPHLIVHKPAVRGTVTFGDEVITVCGDEAHLPRRLREALKKEAKKDFDKAAHRYAAVLDQKIAKIQIRDTRTRWGSCSTERVLCFSWRLIFAPPFVLDYLAAHEVAHMKIMDHSAAFWKLVEELCSDTPQARKWLKANGNMLLAIG